VERVGSENKLTNVKEEGGKEKPVRKKKVRGPTRKGIEETDEGSTEQNQVEAPKG